MADDPSHTTRDPYLPEGGLAQLSDGELRDLMMASTTEAPGSNNNSPTEEGTTGDEDII